MLGDAVASGDLRYTAAGSRVFDYQELSKRGYPIASSSPISPLPVGVMGPLAVRHVAPMNGFDLNGLLEEAVEELAA